MFQAKLRPVESLGLYPGWRSRSLRLRPRTAHAHPSFEVGNQRLRQGFLRRHGGVLVFIAHCLDEQTGIGLARHDGRPGVASLEQAGPTVEPQTGLELGCFGRVAGIAVLGQHWSNLVLKELDVFGGGMGCGHLCSPRFRANQTQPAASENPDPGPRKPSVANPQKRSSLSVVVDSH